METRMKKKVSIIAIAVLAVFAFMTYILTYRHTYTENDKFIDHNIFANRKFLPGFEASARIADIIVEGKVVSNGREQFIKMWSENPNVKIPDGMGHSYTVYDVSINSVWAGDYEESIITVYFPNSGPVPKRNDEIITFLTYLDSPDIGRYYLPVDLEFSSFIINPDGTLFSFAKETESAKYDGKQPEELKNDVYLKISEFAEQNITVGDAVEAYRRDNDAT
ncbi:MAG: hypothetical protein IKM31_07355 [Oscillospiraceae bacterium]|nr:hypothetical protein [Oscillospiraceae bacterium]